MTSHPHPVLVSNDQPEAQPSAADVLRKAADLIAAPGAWTQGAFGRDAKGMVRPIQLESVNCFCALGAIAKAAHRNPHDAWVNGPHTEAAERLEDAIGGYMVADWNDDPKRTQAEVVAALRKAADLADADTSERSDRTREEH